MMASPCEDAALKSQSVCRGAENTASVSAKPRLLIVGPRLTNIGGVEIVTEAVLASDAFSDFQVRHFDSTKGRPKHTQGRFDLPNTIWAARFFVRMLWDMMRFKPDVVYMPLVGRWAPFMRDCTLAFIARVMGAQVVGHVHGGSIIKTMRARGWRRPLVRMGLRNFHTLLPLGATVQLVFEEEGYQGQTVPVPSTMSPGFFERAVSRKTDDIHTKLRGLFVGQVGDRKGVPELLEAMAIVKDQALPIGVRVVGPEELTGDAQRLLALRHRLDVEDVVQFSGPLRGEDLDAAYRESDFFVLPSHEEMLPIVLLEAGVYSLPVLTTPVGAIPDLVVNDVSGLLVSPGDPQEIASGMRRLLDSNLRARLGKRLHEVTHNFHPDVVCRRIAAAVRDVTMTRTQRNSILLGHLRNVAWPPLIVAIEFICRHGQAG